MIAEGSSHPHCDEQLIRARVLRAIAANRTPGLHFIGHFLNFEWQKVSGGTARAVFPEGPHCRAANGEVDLVALGIFIDQSLAAAVRTGTRMPPGGRLGTIHLEAQFTGTPAVGNLEADSRLLGYSEGEILRQSLASATICAQGRPICHINGACAPLKAPPGVTLGPLPWERRQALPVIPLAGDELEPHELAVLQSCDAALRKVSPQSSFIQRFWGGQSRRTGQGASNRVPIGPQITNRVGHVQGGALFGLAAVNACAAAPSTMMLWNLSAFFISPGRGSALTIRSRVMHAGRTLAVVRTEIKNAGGERVLEAISNHVAARRD
ncbi:MAG: PaaI family thioesterase [Deltaproteobacteria bacterium]|nr:PaaI family thioesterase [Deltaproteobacteria bacterium]